MKVNLHNSSNQTLYTVARIAYPQTYQMPMNPGLELPDGTRLPLIKEQSIGTISNIYTVRCNLNPGPIQAETVGSVDGAESTFTLSNWVTKHLAGTVLRIFVTLEDDTELLLWGDGSRKHIRATPHVQVFELDSYVVQGFKVKQYLTAFTEMDHVEFKLGLNWHDRNDPSYGKRVKRVRLECSDEFVIHYQNAMNLPKATYLPQIDVWRLDLIPGPQEFSDGQGFELRGYILTAPEELLTGIDDLTDRRLNNLNAVRNGNQSFGGVGEVVGLAEDMNFDGNWFRGFLPKNLSGQANYQGMFWEPKLLGLRSRGSSKIPGQTGGQEDFGADKGLEATVLGQASWLTYIKGAIVSRYRWYNLHEPNGDRVEASKHPNRKTWNMATFHPHSTDLLGKAQNASRPDGTGWSGFDNQHRSLNNDLTYYVLTGDELILDTILNMLEADYAQTSYDLADREVGRMFDFWSKCLRVLPILDSVKLKDHTDKKFTELLSKFRGRFFTNSPERNVNVLQVIIDPRSNVVNPVTGKIEPCWIPFQFAQKIVGVYSYYMETKDPRAASLLSRLSETFLRYGVFKQGNLWYPVMFERYRTGLPSGQNVNNNEMCPEEGMPLPPESFNTESWEVKIDPFYSQSWWDWVCPAVQVAREFVWDDALIQKATEILDYAYPNGLQTIQSACWFPLWNTYS